MVKEAYYKRNIVVRAESIVVRAESTATLTKRVHPSHALQIRIAPRVDTKFQMRISEMRINADLGSRVDLPNVPL